jgi:hypothetical protein
MFGPGAYRPDPTEGITAIADLPPPEIVHYSRNDKRQPCPRCGHSAYRDKQAQRTLHDLGNLDLWCPRELVVTYSQHYCTKCQKYFNAPPLPQPVQESLQGRWRRLGGPRPPGAPEHASRLQPSPYVAQSHRPAAEPLVGRSDVEMRLRRTGCRQSDLPLRLVVHGQMERSVAPP